MTGVTATGDQVLIRATGPNPAPGLAALRQDLNAAGLNGLDVRVSLIPASYSAARIGGSSGMRHNVNRRVITSTDQFLDARPTGGILPILVRPGAIHAELIRAHLGALVVDAVSAPSRSHFAARRLLIASGWRRR